jgi:hypothetical protein
MDIRTEAPRLQYMDTRKAVVIAQCVWTQEQAEITM